MYFRIVSAASSFFLLLILSLAPLPAMPSLPTGPGTNILTSFAASPNGGFWVQVDGGIDNDENGGSRTLAIGGAPQFNSVPYRGSIAAIPGHEGYWIVTDRGAIFVKDPRRLFASVS
ncbi:MAG: hypothetical protein WBY93_16220 [Candidatus Binatus sp.]